MNVAAAIAMSVGAYKTQLLFRKMQGQSPVASSAGAVETTHPPGAT